MHPQKTYELRVSFTSPPSQIAQIKQKIINWLLVQGVESFVEGTLEVDINQNQDEPPRDHYSEMGGDLSPLSIYRYSKESLEDLMIKLENDFRKLILTEIHVMDTETWMEGWKESFKPFSTKRFYVRPPWDQSLILSDKVELIVEPGMAFGTGQHATTKLCLEMIDEITTVDLLSPKLGPLRVLDVGTGTGILAIAARLLGYGYAVGTDIEDDAILAARENALLNKTSLELYKGCIPSASFGDDQVYHVVFANILAVVILRILPELARATSPGGLLILSGILSSECYEVETKALAIGLNVLQIRHLDGWACLVVSHPVRACHG